MGAIFDNKVSEVIFTLVETNIQFAPVVSSIVIQNDTGESQDSPDSNMSGSNELCEIQVGTENDSGSMNSKKNQDSGSEDCRKKRKNETIRVSRSDESDSDSTKKGSLSENRIQNVESNENPDGPIGRILDSDDSETETWKKSKRSYRVESDDSDRGNNDTEKEILTNTDENHSETVNVDGFIDRDINHKTDSGSEVVGERSKCVSSIQEKNNLVNNKKIIFQTCSDSDDESKNNFKKTKVSDIVDSDTSEDETSTNYDTLNEIKNNLSKKKVQNSSKKMTGKEALEQRREIKSESQRMLRESRISIPYHKPKPRTIKEFFKNRPRISDPIPESVKYLSPSMAIKVATTQLKVFSERLQEREKFVKEFYKSESDSDSENTKDVKMYADENNLKQSEVIDSEPNQNELVQIKDVIFDNVDKITDNLDISKEINEIDLKKDLNGEKSVVSSDLCTSTLCEETPSINETQLNKSKKNTDLNVNTSLELLDKSNKSRVSLFHSSQMETSLEGEEVEKNIACVVTDKCERGKVLENNLLNSQQKIGISESNLIRDSSRVTDILSVNYEENKKRDTEDYKTDTKCDRAVLNNISISFKDLFNSMDSDITVSQLKEELLKSFINPSNLVKQKPSNLYTSLQEFDNVSLAGKKYSESVEELWSKSNSHNSKSCTKSSENVINLTADENDEETNFVNSLFSSSNNDLKLVQESIETLEKIPSKMCELDEKQSKITNQIDCNSNSVDYQSDCVLNSDLVSQNIPKLTNSQIDNLKECAMENKKKNIWHDLNAFNELDSDDENDSGKINRLKNDQSKISIMNDVKDVPVEYTRPKLIGGPNTVIDLDEDVSKPKGMNTLMKRYMNHITKKQTDEKKLELKVISSEGGRIHEDRFAVPVNKVDDTGAGSNFEKPGVKLMRLKGDLKQQIMQKRSEEWAKKEQELKELHGKDEESEDEDDVYKGEKEDCCEDQNDMKKINDEDIDSEDVDDEELVEDDVEMRDDSRKIKSVFINEEADEDEEDDEQMEVNEDSEEENEDSDESENYEGDCEENDKSDFKAVCGVKRLKRIKAFEDDSDSDTEIEKMKKAAEEAVDRAIDCTDTPKKYRDISCNNMDVFEVNNSDCEDEIPVHQRTLQCTPVTSNSSKSLSLFQSKSDNSFVSPVLKLTALQGMSSTTMHNIESPEISQFFLSSEPSPLRDGKSAKRLFSDLDPENSQENYDELMNLCSGKFTTQNCVVSAKENKTEPFTEHSQWLNSSKTMADNKNGSGKLLRSEREDNELKSVLVGSLSLSADTISLDKDDIDETSNNSQNFKLVWLEESDNELKGIEDSSSKKLIQTPLPSKDIEIFHIVSSSDEENQLDTAKRNKKLIKKKMKLKFSDDEHSDSESETNPKENADEEIEDEIILVDENENSVEDRDEEIDYDSEENEVVFSKKTKTSDFFEKEAELSESDWDSVDEDEKGLDEFEKEEGDDDNIDQKKVRNELERIHMRQVRDDDQREVRMLQEILFEDGELHSETGRKRQFKWRNIDDVGVDENAPPEDDADNIAYDEEEDTEEHWRRTRHEREKFLEEKRTKLLRNNDGQDLLDLELKDDDSQIMKLGQAALRRSMSTTQPKTNISNGITICQTESIVTKSVTIKSSSVMSNVIDIKKPFTLVNKRGSFLARGENALARLAAITKDSSEIQVNSLKNTRNFVFTTVDPVEKVQSSSEIVEKQTPTNKGKRKANVDSTPTILKKLKVADSLARSKNSRVQKLFDAM